ncbi:hypothetical protein SDC9_190709 [bioreactor metagenome]|uniref:Uncharacterized protein n=1 Tax=bioreactor metagenome TaxID=1076179 RepID=A0A645HWB2_9ZZZZ
MPLETRTPTRSRLIPVSRMSSGSPAQAKASMVATMAYWQNKSSRLASLKFKYLVTSKFLISPAILVRYSETSNLVTGPMPQRPATMASQNSGTVLPTHDSAPNPVTTTRLSFIIISFPSTQKEPPQPKKIISGSIGPFRQ